MKIFITLFMFCLFAFSDALQGINESPLGQKDKSPIISSEDSSCIIEITDTALKKEYNCFMHIFSYKHNIIYTDSNTEYTQYFYPLKHPSQHIKLFDRYDSPVGIRKLLIIDIKSKNILMSDWFDEGASGDSIDVKSIDLADNSFKVWSFESKYNKSYTVNLIKVTSW